MQRWLKPDGTYSSEPQPCPYFTGQKKRTANTPGCKPVGRLTLILDGLIKQGFVGYVLFTTTSKHDIRSLYASLLDAANFRAGHPHGLRGIEWLLCRETVAVSTPGEGGKRVRRQKSLVRIRPSAEWVQHQLAQAQAEALGGLLPETEATPMMVNGSTGEIMAPPPADDDDDDDVIDVETQACPSAIGEGTAADEQSAYCDPPAFLDNAAKREGVRTYLLDGGVPEAEVPSLIEAWRRRCLDRSAILQEANKIIASLKARDGGKGATTSTSSAAARNTAQAVQETPASTGTSSQTPSTPPSQPEPNGQATPASAPAEDSDDVTTGTGPEWMPEVQKLFIEAQMPVALRDACLTVWAALGSTRTEAVTAFRKVRSAYKNDPEEVLAYWQDLAKEQMKHTDKPAAVVTEPEPF